MVMVLTGILYYYFISHDMMWIMMATAEHKTKDSKLEDLFKQRRCKSVESKPVILHKANTESCHPSDSRQQEHSGCAEQYTPFLFPSYLISCQVISPRTVRHTERHEREMRTFSLQMSWTSYRC